MSFPEAQYFDAKGVSPEKQAELQEYWRAAGVVVDSHQRDLAILELPKEGEPLLPDGAPLFRALRFAAADTLEGKKNAVGLFGYGQSGYRQSGTNITWGTLSSIDTVRGFLRTSAEILPGHSGSPLVVEYTNRNGHQDFAAIAYAVSSKKGELGNCRPVAYVQEA